MSYQYTLDISLTPHELYKRIRVNQTFSCILESAGDDSAGSRYTFIGFDPLYTVYCIDGKVYKRMRDGSVTLVHTADPFGYLRTLVDSQKGGQCGIPFQTGLIGYVGYDAVEMFEPVKVQKHPDFYTYEFGMYMDAIIYDRQTGVYQYVSFDTDRRDFVFAAVAHTPTPTYLHVTRASSTADKKQHALQVHKVQEKIRGGYIFQCEVGVQKSFQLSGDPYHLYTKLRTINPSPYMYYLSYESRVITGASPELLVRCADGFAETFPLAGTRGRGKDTDEDISRARELSTDAKEIAEHSMLIDLHRNDLGKVCMPNTIKVRNPFMLKKFSHVQHLSTEISGILDKGKDMFDLFAACFPVGTVTGTPKIEAMKIIASLESFPRGPYGGAIGFFGCGGICEFAIAIRTFFISGDVGYIQACGGVVLDSRADGEYIEIVRKLAAQEAVLQYFTHSI